MQPDDRHINSGDPRGRVQPPVRDPAENHAAVEQIARDQVDAVYQDQHGTGDSSKMSNQQLPTSYKKTHGNAHTIHEQQWRQYHSAWQDYYQKYYEHYYMGAVRQVQAAYSKKGTEDTAQTNAAFPLSKVEDKETITRDEAVDELRGKLLQNVSEKGQKLRKSRHFVPLISALAVLLVFVFLQYNSLIIANVKAYVTPGDIDPQNIVVDPNASLQVSNDPRLIIPKINVNEPVDYNTTPDQDSQLKAMQNGVAYFGIPGANSKPGQIGNTVISGHSSNDFIETGSHKFVFALLDRLKPGDIFYLNYNGIRYTYSVTRTKVVKPTDVSALVYPTTKPEVTLITCTPLGTALNRLLVTAEQVSPNPASASPAPDSTATTDKSVMPGNSPTVFEKLFGN